MPGALFLMAILARDLRYYHAVRWAALLMALLIISILVYQLTSGIVLNRWWGVGHRRSEDPKAYWTTLLIQAGLALVILTSWAYKFFTR